MRLQRPTSARRSSHVDTVTETSTMENGEMSSDAGACRVLNKEVLSKGRWVALNEITYTDPSGKERKWESAERTTKISGESDGVVIIPVLKRLLKYDCVVLVKQFRPPVGTVTIEFPAGLIDRGESAQECAVRELKEETGFTGVVKHISPCTTIDPGLSNCTLKMVTMEIDGDLAENYHPRKHLGVGNFSGRRAGYGEMRSLAGQTTGSIP